MLRTVIDGYARLLGVELSDAASPARGWTSFGEFFVRELRPGARAFDDDPAALASPCDGVIEAVGPLCDGAFVVKGRCYRAAELLGRGGWWDAPGAAGGVAVVYLSPADYHRVHSPTAARLRGVERIPGSCFPVNRLGQAIAPHAVVRNERVVFSLATDRGGLAVVMVGALGVRAIGVTVPDAIPTGDEVRVERAQELGRFNLGSTVVLVWERAWTSAVKPGERVLLGQRLVVLGE
jgi:phosphatidylserine decarboxylase